MHVQFKCYALYYSSMTNKVVYYQLVFRMQADLSPPVVIGSKYFSLKVSTYASSSRVVMRIN